MRVLRIAICFLFFFNQGLAQIDNDIDFSTHFAMEVHSVDDFFDRFNFKQNSTFFKYVKVKFPNKDIDRKGLIVSLFNKQNTTFKPEALKSFIIHVTDSLNPRFLKYNDKEWYAELKCKVSHKNKPLTLTLILKVNKSKNNGYSWDIVSAKSEFLKFRATKSDSILLRNMKNFDDSILLKNSEYFLSPVSHGIDFTNIDEVFLNNSHINSYIYPGTRSFELVKLLSLMARSEIQFVQVDKIRYHLLQISDWVLVLDHFNRNDMNSGWLINQLIRIKDSEKAGYKLRQLNIPKI